MRMSIYYLILLAIALSADSFAVATTEGLLLKKAKHLHSFRVAVVFGVCQGVMPLLGWLIGHTIYDLIDTWADWVAFLILALIGAKMIFNSICNERLARPRSHSLGWKLWTLGIAVSLDALGVGISMAMQGMSLWTPALVIGLVTAATCIAGVQMGGRIGRRMGEKAELVGGVILVMIGIILLF